MLTTASFVMKAQATAPLAYSGGFLVDAAGRIVLVAKS